MTLPGLSMLALGLLLAFTQLAGPVSLGFTSLDIHYMILGVTLSLVGTSATSLGLVVGATLPAGRVKHLIMLAPAYRCYTFDAAAVLRRNPVRRGVVADRHRVLGYWLDHDRGALSSFFTRLTLFGLMLIAMGVQIGLSAILLGTSLTVDRPSTGPVMTTSHRGSGTTCSPGFSTKMFQRKSASSLRLMKILSSPITTRRMAVVSRWSCRLRPPSSAPRMTWSGWRATVNETPTEKARIPSTSCRCGRTTRLNG